MKKLIFFIFTGILLFSLIGIANAELKASMTAYVIGSGQGNENDNPGQGNNQMIGNDSDEHGCKGSAGYTWCENMDECIRSWETNCSEFGLTNNGDMRNMIRLGINITSTRENNETINGGMMSNGKNTMIKIMPETASATAIARLGIKNCNESEGCTIVLKETGTGNQTKSTYEVKARKEAKLFGFIKTHMEVTAEVDAETGNITSTKKPWWAFMAKEE